MKKENWAYVFVGVCAGLIVAKTIQWNSFIDPDAFYHATMSQFILQHGPLKNFPWLDLTLYGKYFADFHFLFHILEIPFIYFFGFSVGIRYSIIFLTVVVAITVLFVFKKMHIRYPAFWVVLLLLTQTFLTRISLGKATPLDIIWFMLGICAWFKNKPYWLAICAFLFALTHAAWIFLLVSICILTCAECLIEKKLQKKHINLFVFCLIGGFIGMLIHPNGLNMFRQSWIHIVSIGLFTPSASLPMGLEWKGLTLSDFILMYDFWILILMFGIVGYSFSRKQNILHDERVRIFSIGVLSLVLFFMTLKSARTAEYFSPIFVLFIASIWNIVDIKKSYITKWGIGSITLCVILVTKGYISTWQDFRKNTFADSLYSTSTRIIAERAHPADRVFNNRWDDFPVLFHALAGTGDIRFISGLDPVPFDMVSSTLSHDYNELSFGTTTPTKEQVWSVIHDRAHSQFIFISYRGAGYKRLLHTIASDQRYTKISESDDSLVFTIDKTP